MRAREIAGRAELESLFGARSSFDETERALYGHDVAVVPPMLARLAWRAVPDGIAQPEREAELVALVRWALSHRVPLTPRAKATSGYGGVIPVRRGIVVDLTRMKRIVHLDAAALTVTVEPCVVWEKLDAALADHGLTLRLYPTSYPSSTVGGWLAQGGAGIGSFEAGWFRDNVLRARVVLPTGEVGEFSGGDLALVADAEGTTGFISELTIRVQRLEPLQIAAIGCATPAALQRAVEQIVAARLPVWSLGFINPQMAQLKSQAPLMEHWGRPVGERVDLPAQHILLLAWRTGDAERSADDVPAVRDDGRRARCRGEHLGGLPQGPVGVVPIGPRREARAVAPVQERILRRLHGELLREGHRPRQRAAARRSRRRFHLPR